MSYPKSSTKQPVRLVARLVAGLAVAALLLAAPAAAQAAWGAIAVDPITGHYGVSYDYNTARAAQHRARVECGSNHCKVAVWVANGYAALVQKRSNGLYFAGFGRTKHAAFAKATHRAHEPGARHVAWVFSGY
ncbi:MAG: DUF4189 domain-containing protein [Actinobacteria bacterium]|nr:DUF4189 domain-containing protein [Actinomycetota bacterium]